VTPRPSEHGDDVALPDDLVERFAVALAGAFFHLVLVHDGEVRAAPNTVAIARRLLGALRLEQVGVLVPSERPWVALHEHGDEYAAMTGAEPLCRLRPLDPEVPMPDFTQDVGYVHVGKSLDGPFECRADCPHPDHLMHVCDVAGCERAFPTMAEVVAHEATHRGRS
jgi:hypothetical protein